MKGIWNRLRLALLGGILALAGAGMAAPLSGGVVVEAAPGDYIKVNSADNIQDGRYVLGDVDSYGLLYKIESKWGLVSTREDPLVLTLELSTEKLGYFWLSHDGSYIMETDKDFATTSVKPIEANLKWVVEDNRQGIGSDTSIIKSNTGSLNKLRFYKTDANTMPVPNLYRIEEASSSGEYVPSIEVSPSALEVTAGSAIDLALFQVTAGGEPYEHYIAEIGTKTGEDFVKREVVESGVTLYEIGDNCIRFTANDAISAEDEGHAFADVSIVVTVPEATSVSVDPSEAETIVGGTVQLSATVLPVGASQEVTWSTEEDIVSVSDDGLVTGLKVGEATVTATSANGKAGSATINVSNEVVGSTTLAGNAGVTDVKGVASGETAVWEVKDRFTLTQYQNSGSNIPVVTYEEIRLYKGHTLVFAPAENVRITSIELKANQGSLANEDYYSNANWTGSATAGTLTPIDPYDEVTIGPATEQIRLSSIIVHWTYAIPPEFGTLARVEVLSAPARLSYMTGDAASLEGLSVVAYDEDGNSEFLSLDEEGLSITPTEGYVFQEKDVGSHQAVVSYTRGDVTVEAETTWTYTVELLQVTEYVKATSLSDILLGDEIILVGSEGGTTYAMGAQSGDYRGAVEINAPADGKITLADNVTDVARIAIRVSGVAKGSLSLYDGEGEDEGYLASGNSTNNNLYTNQEQDGNSSWVLASKDGSLTLTAVEGSRTTLRFNYNRGNPRFSCYQTTSDMPYVEIYVRAHSSADQAAELSRYLMESDTENQCDKKFEIAKSAYLNRMGEDGRELFKTGDEYLAAKERYEAWANHLGQLPYEEGAVQAFRFFNGNADSMNWAIAGASLGIVVLGAAGYLFYRKKKVAR